MKILCVFALSGALGVMLPLRANPLSLDAALTAFRVRSGLGVMFGGTTLNVSVPPPVFSPLSPVSPYEVNAIAPPTIRTVNVVVDSGFFPVPRYSSSQPLAIGSVTSVADPGPALRIGSVLVTNPRVLREVNTTVKASRL